MAMLADPVVLWLCALTLALLFGSAAWHKVRDRQGFVAVLAAYELLPASSTVCAAFALMALETMTAAALLLPLTRTVGALSALVLLTTYTAAISWNLWRGRLAMDCGCMGGGGKSLSGWLVVRNGLVMTATMPLLLASSDVAQQPAATALSLRATNALDLLTILVGALCTAVLYLVLDRLIANHLALQDWLNADA